MTQKKYLSLERLTEYDGLIKTHIDEKIEDMAYIDIENNENVTEAEIPQIQQVQSDWNEEDETSPAFVKNRPFYDYTVKTDFVFSRDINKELAKSDILPNVGQNYTVIVNGQKQMFTVQKIEMNGFSLKYVGTCDVSELISGQSKGWAIASDPTMTMLIGLVEDETVITIDTKKNKQIDTKYLPINAPWEQYTLYKVLEDYIIYMLYGCTVKDCMYRPLIVNNGHLYMEDGSGLKYARYKTFGKVMINDKEVLKESIYVFIDSEDGYIEFCENHGITV